MGIYKLWHSFLGFYQTLQRSSKIWYVRCRKLPPAWKEDGVLADDEQMVGALRIIQVEEKFKYAVI